MYKINLKHFLCIYFRKYNVFKKNKNVLNFYSLVLCQNVIYALTENNDNHKTLASTKLKQGKPILINGKDYILNVAQEFVHELEEYGFCNFKLSNFSHKIEYVIYY